MSIWGRNRAVPGVGFGFLAVLLMILAGALWLRLPDLGNRPFHGDEAVHAVKFDDLWEHGVYRYDANEFHGPTIYYAALPSVRLKHRASFAATQEADYRLPVALLGAAMILLFLPLRDALGKPAALVAALLTAVSPAFVFYSRYYIQEIFLVFFTLGLLVCGWRYTQSRRLGWAVGGGLCAGLMIASKETAVLTFAAMGISLALTSLWTRRVDGRRLNLRGLMTGRVVALALTVALVTACLFLSGFLTNLAGPIDYLRSYTPWLHRANGTDLHRHGLLYYLRLLAWTHTPRKPVWSEALTLGLAVVGASASLRRRVPRPTQGSANSSTNDSINDSINDEINGNVGDRAEVGSAKNDMNAGRETNMQSSVTFARFLTFYTLALTGLYSVIPYKTPWCALSFLNGMILLAGAGAATLLQIAPGRAAKGTVGLLLVTGVAQLAWQAYQSSYVYYADDANPYVYAQPVQDAVRLSDRVALLSQSSPQREQTVIYVFSIDAYYWPLPWDLRRFSNVGYWTGQVPPDLDAPIILASPEFDEELTRKLDATHLMTGYFSLRSNAFFQLWVRDDLWKAYLADKKRLHPDPDDGP